MDAQSRQIARLFSSILPIGTSPPLHQQASMPPLGPWGTHSLAGEGVGGPNSDEGTDTVVL